MFLRICPDPSRQLDPTNPLILRISTKGGEEPPSAANFDDFVGNSQFFRVLSIKSQLLGSGEGVKDLGFWEIRKRRKKHQKKEKNIKRRGENCDRNRRKSEMKRIFSISISRRETGAKSGNSGGNLRIARGSLGRDP